MKTQTFPLLARAPTHITLNNLAQTHKAMSIPSPSFPYSLPPSPSPQNLSPGPVPKPFPHPTHTAFFPVAFGSSCRAVRHPFWQGIWDRLACPPGFPFNKGYKLLPMCCTLLARGDGWFAAPFGKGVGKGFHSWEITLIRNSSAAASKLGKVLVFPSAQRCFSLGVQMG